MPGIPDIELRCGRCQSILPIVQQVDDPCICCALIETMHDNGTVLKIIQKIQALGAETRFTRKRVVFEFNADSAIQAHAIAAICRTQKVDIVQPRGSDVLLVVFPNPMTEECRDWIQRFARAKADVSARRESSNDLFIVHADSAEEAEEACLAFECVDSIVQARCVGQRPWRVAVCL